jgi:phospholipase C
MAPDPTVENLSKIDHIVVLMMENRSFDHMLGHLSLDGRTDVDGLKPGMKNVHAGRDYPIHHLTSTKMVKAQDPCHGAGCIQLQMSNDMGGFVDSYAKDKPNDPDPGIVMGYFDGKDLPVYEHLAADYVVCDRWFCSVPAGTWPNRLYAVTGTSQGTLDDPQPVPLYDIPSFVRQLDDRGVSWGWYCHDVATLRVTDGRYRVGHFGNYSWFDQRTLAAPKSFVDAAAAGELPSVSWIDPNFIDVGFVGPSGSNDDHPPSDVRDGQTLVLKLYHALVTSRQWERTLLVVTYDEHGGFFDHVPPPAARDDYARTRRYGPRVPAFVISPWVDAGVTHRLFDHTSIIKTILLRFCRDAQGNIPKLTRRVTEAHHLGELLSRSTPRPAPSARTLRPLTTFAARHQAEVFRQTLQLPLRGEQLDPTTDLNDLQEGILLAEGVLRATGLPPGQP